MREDLPEGTGLSFEDFRHENGHTFWWASDLQRMLAYDTWKSFFKVIAKAQKLLASIEVPVSEHILASERAGEEEGLPVQDFKLTRFACLVIVIQADASKPEVARAQVLLAGQARLLQEAFERGAVDLDRLVVREEIKEGNVSLSSVLKKYGGFRDPRDYAIFHNAGYLGMYNMGQDRLMQRRGIKDKRKIFDTMSRAELAANLFRITQTEEYLKKHPGLRPVEMNNAHKRVGQEVRDLVKRNTGVAPEDMPQELPLPAMKKALKGAKTDLQRLDKKSK